MTLESALPNRPVLHLPHSTFEILLEVAAGVVLGVHAILIASTWSTLSDAVPVHFGPSGIPDRWGGKGFFLLPGAVSLLLYLALTVLSRFPHSFNYPWPITGRNVARQYQIGRAMILSLKVESVLIFLYLQWRVVRILERNLEGLGRGFAPAVLILLIGTMTYFVFQAYRAR